MYVAHDSQVWPHGRTSSPARRQFAALLALALLLCCTRPPQNEGSTQAAGHSLPKAQVLIHPASGSPQVALHVELARTPEEQARGLMFRKDLSPSTGMLFLFDRPEVRRFWMKNTLIPLDMLFFDDQRLLIGIEENTTPHDETGRGPDQPAQYVLEVPGGYARSHGIGPGSRVEFVDVQ